MHILVILNPGDQQLRSKYKQQRNELTSNLRNSELNYHSDELELNKSDLYKTWGTMKKNYWQGYHSLEKEDTVSN